MLILFNAEWLSQFLNERYNMAYFTDPLFNIDFKRLFFFQIFLANGDNSSPTNTPVNPAATLAPNSTATSEEYLNKKITFIQNHINNLLVEITNLPEPWTYAVTEDGRVFFIK